MEVQVASKLVAYASHKTRYFMEKSTLSKNGRWIAVILQVAPFYYSATLFV
ncbi:hypothetical protein [Aeromonas veronii]|uniref:hypothetical protein n=1 Tax=Aeromonas veronii TaxID=654 RepID=UPI002B4A1E34|nr:hypothetical protein [Aeromonas veronii]